MFKNIDFGRILFWGPFLVFPISSHVSGLYEAHGFIVAVIGLVFALAFVEVIKGAWRWINKR